MTLKNFKFKSHAISLLLDFQDLSKKEGKSVQGNNSTWNFTFYVYVTLAHSTNWYSITYS